MTPAYVVLWDGTPQRGGRQLAVPEETPQPAPVLRHAESVAKVAYESATHQRWLSRASVIRRALRQHGPQTAAQLSVVVGWPSAVTANFCYGLVRHGLIVRVRCESVQRMGRWVSVYGLPEAGA